VRLLLPEHWLVHMVAGSELPTSDDVPHKHRLPARSAAEDNPLILHVLRQSDGVMVPSVVSYLAEAIALPVS
jgi:hypothetical protein